MPRMPWLLLGLLICGGNCSVEARAADKSWFEARSPHFQVISNGATNDVQKVMRELEQLRWAFSVQFPGARLDSGAPLLILATRDVPTYKNLDPSLWKAAGTNVGGVFYHHWEKEYAIVRLDTFGGEGSKEVVYHEYAHSILGLNAHWIPLWLNEGWAEFYGYSRFEQRKVYLGAQTKRYRALRSETPIPVETLISRGYLSKYQEALFYAESWALVHYLTFGPGMEKGRRLSQFFQRLQDGTDQKQAFIESFGDFKTLDRQLASYMQKPTFDEFILSDPPQLDDKDISFRTLSAAETEAELGGFHLRTRDRAGAQLLLEQALKQDPNNGLVHENMGFLKFEEGKDTEAASEFSAAYASDPNLYLSLFAKTMLSRLLSSTVVSDLNTFGATMRKVLQINSQFAPAYVQLARVAIREGDWNAALIMSRRAEELEPSLAGYHLLTGQILRRTGKSGDAASYAKFVAERWIGADHNEAVELWNDIPVAERPTDTNLIFLAPKETQRAEGKIKSVECSEKDQTWSLTLDDPSGPLTFHRKAGFETGFSDTIWYGEDHFNLCHHLQGYRAIIHYNKAADSTYAGDVAELEIRDDLVDLFAPPKRVFRGPHSNEKAFVAVPRQNSIGL